MEGWLLVAMHRLPRTGQSAMAVLNAVQVSCDRRTRSSSMLLLLLLLLRCVERARFRAVYRVCFHNSRPHRRLLVISRFHSLGRNNVLALWDPTVITLRNREYLVCELRNISHTLHSKLAPSHPLGPRFVWENSVLSCCTAS